VPKLLLADDSPTTQKVVQLTFVDEGIDVIVADDGDTAMELYDRHRPDIVLADINIPGLNGYEVCETIRKRAWNGTTPVILLAGSFEPFDVEEAHRVGANDYLTKPFSSIRRLVATVTAMLDTVTRQDTAVEETIEPNSMSPDRQEPDMMATNDIEQLYHESVSTDDATKDSVGEINSSSDAEDEPVAEPPSAEQQAAEPLTFADGLAYDDELIETTFTTAETPAAATETMTLPVNENSDTRENISLESIPMPEVEPEPVDIPQSQIPTVSFGSDQVGNSDGGEMQTAGQSEVAPVEFQDPEPALIESAPEEFQIDQSADEAFFEPAPEAASATEERPPVDSEATTGSPLEESFSQPGELISDQFQPESFAVPEIDRPEELASTDAAVVPPNVSELMTEDITVENADRQEIPTPWDSVAGPATSRSFDLESSNLLELPFEEGQENQRSGGPHSAGSSVRSLTPELIDHIAKETAAQISEELVRKIAERVVPRIIDEVLREREREG